MKYEQLKQCSQQFGEANDCAVTAVAVVTGECYEMAHYALEEQGRKRRKGTYLHQTIDALTSLGYKTERVSREDWRHLAKTGITISRVKLEGSYLVSFREHVAGYANGQLHDWSTKSRMRILSLYRITKEGE